MSERVDLDESSNTSTNNRLEEAEANRTSRASTTSVVDALDRTAESLDEQARREASDQQRTARSESSSLRENHVAFRSLESLRSRHLVLRVELTADETHEIIRVFEGSQGRVIASGDVTGQFPIVCQTGGR